MFSINFGCRIAALAFLFGLLSLSACGDERGYEDTTTALSRGLNGDPESLDPHRYSSIQAGDILRDIGEGLVSISPTGELTEGVAESWRVSSDGRTYTFKIRSEARWSTGENVSAEDFVNTFRRGFDPSTAATSTSKLELIQNAKSIVSGELDASKLGVREVNDETLEIQLEYPAPHFLSLLAHPSAFPIYQKRGPSEGAVSIFRPGEYVSNGAYVLHHRVPGSEIVLRRNSQYWDDDNTHFDTVIYHVVSPSREVTRFLAGELDVTSNVDGDAFHSLRETHKAELLVSPYLGTYYYGFNLTKEPFKSNVSLREALSLAIDRQTIVKSVTKRGEIPAFNFVPPGVENYQSPRSQIEDMTQDDRENRARELYVQAGYSLEDPEKFELRYNTDGGHEKIALAVSSMWRSVLGLEVNLVKEEFGVFIENVMSMRDTEIFRLSWTGNYNDAQNFLQLFESDNSNNLTGYANAQVDDLLRQGGRETDLERRRELLNNAEELALSEFPVIPIYYFVSKHLVAAHICGWESNLLDIHMSKTLRSCEN